jgi:hypothetical protein
MFTKLLVGELPRHTVSCFAIPLFGVSEWDTASSFNRHRRAAGWVNAKLPVWAASPQFSVLDGTLDVIRQPIGTIDRSIRIPILAYVDVFL